ncbi:MAG: hypothetical protein M0Q91_05055 [Methanoregula sp.]|jgi:hypothetical protein|nr:hypothetical protein [Methanoregula sp.]
MNEFTRLKTKKDHARAILRYLGYSYEAVYHDQGKIKRIEDLLEHYLTVTLKDSGMLSDLKEIKNQLKADLKLRISKQAGEQK